MIRKGGKIKEEADERRRGEEVEGKKLNGKESFSFKKRKKKQKNRKKFAGMCQKFCT